MKRVFAVLLLFLMVPVCAHASVMRDACTITTAYNTWSSVFGAEDISWEDDFQNDPENASMKYWYTDDLIIKFDFSNHQFDVIWVLFQCNAHSGAVDPENKARRLGFFAALEYGLPTTFSQSEIDEVYSIAQAAYDGYYDVMGRNLMKLYAGEPVLLRKNEYGTYYLYYNETEGFCITVV